MKTWLKITLIIILIFGGIWLLFAAWGYWAMTSLFQTNLYELGTLTHAQTEALEVYFGLREDVLENVHDYCYDSSWSAHDTSVSFFAQVDRDEIEYLIQQYGADVFHPVPLSTFSAPGEESFSYMERVRYMSDDGQGGGYCMIYRLVNSDEYYFRVTSPGKEIRFTGVTDEG